MVLNVKEKNVKYLNGKAGTELRIYKKGHNSYFCILFLLFLLPGD